MTPETTYRDGLPADMPARIRKLPINRGYPVPWFVCWLDPNDNTKAFPRGEGVPDFRVIHPGAVAEAFNHKRCWICGGPLGRFKTFVAGPMCGINRTSSEPPSHLDCGDWAARACPFLTMPKMRRREAGLPEELDKPAGVNIDRNPGVAMVWTTRTVTPFNAGNGTLFRMGEPDHVRWYCEGRPANYAEVLHSISTGLPSLKAVAEREPGGVEALQRAVEQTLVLLPIAADLGEARAAVHEASTIPTTNAESATESFTRPA